MTQVARNHARLEKASRHSDLKHSVHGRRDRELQACSLETVLSSLESAATDFDNSFLAPEQEAALTKLEEGVSFLGQQSLTRRSLFEKDSILGALSRASEAVDDRIIAPQFAKRFSVVAAAMGAIANGAALEMEREVAPLKAGLASGGALFAAALHKTLRNQEGTIPWLRSADVLAEQVFELPRKPRNSLPVPHGFQEVCRTPVHTSMRALGALELSRKDVLVQLGSGVGDFVALAAVLSVAKMVRGYEYDSGLADESRARCKALSIRRTSFSSEDPRFADLSGANKFFLDAPFVGNALKAVVHNLLSVAKQHPIVVVTAGPLENLEEVSKGYLQLRPADSLAVIVYDSKPPSEIRLPEESFVPSTHGERLFGGAR
jgi:protein-L-isoaspartate O-methyltransferase